MKACFSYLPKKHISPIYREQEEGQGDKKRERGEGIVPSPIMAVGAVPNG